MKRKRSIGRHLTVIVLAGLLNSSAFAQGIRGSSTGVFGGDRSPMVEGKDHTLDRMTPQEWQREQNQQLAEFFARISPRLEMAQRETSEAFNRILRQRGYIK